MSQSLFLWLWVTRRGDFSTTTPRGSAKCDLVGEMRKMPIEASDFDLAGEMIFVFKKFNFF